MLWGPKMVPFGCFAPLNCESFLLRINPGWEPPLRYAWLCSREARLCAGHEFVFEKTIWGTMGLLRIRDVTVCVDGARDAGSSRVGALIPGVGVRTHVAPHARFASQQTTELRGVAWAIRFAVRARHKSVTVFSDSEAAIAQVLRMRATSHLTHHQAVLRSLARVLWVSGIVVRLVWVPSALQPGDPMSRVASVFRGSRARAEVEAWRTWDKLLDNLGEARVRGVVCLRG